MRILGTTSSHISFPIITGGTLSTGANHYYRKFTSGANTFTTSAPIEIEYIAIAAGGGGGSYSYEPGIDTYFIGGGGGAGRYATATQTIPIGTWTITIGEAFNLQNGGFTSVTGTAGWSISLPGGGRGGNGNAIGTSGSSGGSGGGGGGTQPPDPTYGGSNTIGTPAGLGNNGGDGRRSFFALSVGGGAGGGATGPGGSAQDGNYAPGPGVTLTGTEWNTIAGAPEVIGVGGTSYGDGGIPGPNTGSGGVGSSTTGSFGGSGLLILRYLKSAVGG